MLEESRPNTCNPSILVIGDINIDILIFPVYRVHDEKNSPDMNEYVFGWNYEDDFVKYRRPGGVFLVKELIDKALSTCNTRRSGDTSGAPKNETTLSYPEKLIKKLIELNDPPCLQSFSLFGKYPKSNKNSNKNVSTVLKNVESYNKVLFKKLLHPFS